MHSLNQVKKLVSCGRDSARSLPLWRGFLLIPLILVCFASAPQTQAGQARPDVSPAPDGCYPGLNTAEGCQALQNAPFGSANTALGWRSLFAPNGASFCVGVGAGSLVLNQGDLNTAVGTASVLLNVLGTRNTGVGVATLLNNAGNAQGDGSFNDAVGAFALNGNIDGFSNNAMGDSALFRNEHGAANTAVGDLALENNDATGDGAANNNTAVGASALLNDVNGSENTGVGAGVGPNIANGFNNTYIGNFVGTDADDEDGTIRINDISNGNGAGSLQCYIGGIWNNPQPVGGSVVLVTLDLDNDHLGFDSGPSGPARPHRSAPQPRLRPQPHQALLNEKVEKLQATVAQQQKEIGQQQKKIEILIAQLRKQAETFTAQLQEHAAEIQKVSAQLEVNKVPPRTVLNNQ